MALSQRPMPFDDDAWTYELKYDGCRLLGVAESDDGAYDGNTLARVHRDALTTAVRLEAVHRRLANTSALTA